MRKASTKKKSAEKETERQSRNHTLVKSEKNNNQYANRKQLSDSSSAYGRQGHATEYSETIVSYKPRPNISVMQVRIIQIKDLSGRLARVHP